MKHILTTLACGVVLAAAASAQTPGYGPPGYPGYGGYTSPGTPGSQFGQGGVRLEKGKTADAYTLRVYTGRRRPQDFEVNVERGHLVLRSLRSEQTDMRRQGGYSYSRSMSRFQRRLPLPRDAIAEQMSRTDGEGIIDIVIPKQR
ncbi:MAG: Hsp20/alpha crystallin family protein [Gammaproteobacteria bacterium]|nr:Hsp20/alpha crystallin family protein [Gammaproteobacteria bacterium]